MVVVITGPNDFARREALAKVTSEFVKTYGEFGLERIDASEIDADRVLEDAASVPFLSKRRMIILSEISANKDLAGRIEQFLDSISEETDLIIYEQKFDKRLSLYKTLKKRTDFREFNELDERSLVSWLLKVTKEGGGSLTSKDAAYLIARVGANQMTLKSELDKLLTYNPNLNQTTIDALVEPVPSSTVFDLLDAAFAGDKKKSSTLYSEQRKQLVEPQAIMGMIAWQLHVLALVKFNEDNTGDVTSNVKLNPYVMRKTASLSRRLSKEQVRNLVSKALSLDVRMKSEQIDADDAVQHFLLAI